MISKSGWYKALREFKTFHFFVAGEEYSLCGQWHWAVIDESVHWGNPVNKCRRCDLAAQQPGRLSEAKVAA